MLNFEDDYTPPAQPAFRPMPPSMPPMPQLQPVTMGLNFAGGGVTQSN